MSVVLASGGDLGFALLDTLRRLLPAGFTRTHPMPAFSVGSALVRHLVGPAFWIVVSLALLRLLRAPVLHAAADDDEQYRALLGEHSGTLGFLGTWEDTQHWFNADGSGRSRTE